MAGRRIREDHKEYLDIVKGNVKDKIRDHIKTGKRLQRRGKDFVVVGTPYIELPNFRYGNSKGKGVGNGDVEEGDEVGDGPPQPGDGDGEPGNESGDHIIDVGVSLDYYFDMLGEELELPNMQPKDNSEIVKEVTKWNAISRHGNNSLLHKRRTLKNALKRVMSLGEYDPLDISNMYPIKEDKEYRSWNMREEPETNAVIFFMSDISASMDESKRSLVRELCWYLENWITRFYTETQQKYIVHDHLAQEVDQETFYKYTSGGGTQISSAFELVSDIIEKAFPLEEWNIYLFYLSDGENFGDDNELCVKHMQKLQTFANLIGITEVKATRSWATFLPTVRNRISSGVLDSSVVVTTSMESQKDIFKALQTLLTPEESAVPF
jgi:uncharacterized sporulation protein YeaH/YhbH (DUF444 family)